MEQLENIVSIIDCLINTNRKRHITGGVLVSVSLLFAGLAITVITSKNEEEDRND